MLSASAPVRPRFDQAHHADPRVAATVTLLAVMMAAALSLVPLRRHAANMPQAAADLGSVATSSTPVKIVGATPRSENCAEQVWPYIEQRCLTRAPAGSKAAAPAMNRTQPAAGRATTGAAPAEPIAPGPAPVAAPPRPDHAGRQRVATTYLPPPVRRQDRAETDGLAAPPGAVPPRRFEPDRSASWAADDASTDRTAEPLWSSEPRRRSARRWHRTRHYQRPIFGFPY